MDGKLVFGERENEGKWDFLGIWSVRESRLLLASLLPLGGFSISGEDEGSKRRSGQKKEKGER
ncbi:hypothetical protein TorRG33x02_294650, partial [Trema orientale]